MKKHLAFIIGLGIITTMFVLNTRQITRTFYVDGKPILVKCNINGNNETCLIKLNKQKDTGMDYGSNN